MRKTLRATFLALAVLIAFTALFAGPAQAGQAPNRLDPPGGGPVGLITDACNSILGPFKDVSDFFDLDVCPSMSGRVLAHPHIWNVFASGDWDATHPASLSTAAINDLTRAIVDQSPGNDYLGPASQYGVGAARFDGSSQNDGCGGAPSGTTNSVSIMLWITCEVQAPLTGIPYPDDNTLYVIYLPASVDINNGPLDGTCDAFSAYHFQSEALTVDWVTENILGVDVPVPPFFHPHFQSYAYAVVPLKCAMHTLEKDAKAGAGPLRPDLVSSMASHEIVEAATDTIVPRGWLDRSTIDFSIDFLKEGEAADICEPKGSAPAKPRRLDNGVLVAPYWSNSDNACVPRLHTLTLKTVGLPDGGTAKVTSRAIYGDSNEHTQSLPHAYCTDPPVPSFPTPAFDCITENARVSWSFPSTVPDSANPAGIRYVTGKPDETTFIDQDITSTAVYGKQFRLTVETSPDSVKSLASSLTPSQWVPSGSTAALDTDAFVPVGSDRYRFTFWSGDGGFSSTSRAATIPMDAPKTATANYVLQHLLTFDQNGIPLGVPWTVTVEGQDHSGPYSEWFDRSSSVGFSFQDPVPALTSGTRYKLVSTDPASPMSVTATRSVTATYKTQRLLTVHTNGLPAPNLATITNNTTVLGTANDAAPLAAWVDDGTSLALAGDADVNGVDGTQYFAQAFSPAPPATLTAPFETTLTYKTMAQLITDALSSGGLTGPTAPGVAAALRRQFAAVEADMGAKRYAAALGDLTAFVNLVQSSCCAPKAGKALTPATAKTFQLDAMLVYHAALCLAGAELSATTMQQRYDYYRQLVTSLGGKVLPSCG